MDRRQFLKTGAAGAIGAVTASSLPVNAATKAEKAYTPLDVETYVREPSRRIPLVDRADVIVVGGGPSGFAAALAAARQGVDVLLLEREYFLGGLFTGCGVTPIINMFHPTTDGKVQAIYGISQELCDRLDKVGMLNYEYHNVRPKVDPEAAKYFMEEMLSESGSRILYGVQAVQVMLSGDEIKCVMVEGKSGRVAIGCRFVIDCSGDGDILEWCSEDFTVYKSDIGAMWRIGNAENCKKGSPTCVKGVRTRHTAGEKNQDGLDMYNLTRVQLSLRKMMWEDSRQLASKEGCSDLFLLDTPSVVGVRVTRVLDSVANVTVEGAACGKSYQDVIGFAGGDSSLSYNGHKIKYTDRKMWQIPYSSITPKRIGNLLVAGRCFGFEEGLTYDSREVGTCLMTGQAAGTASSIAVNQRCGCREVDIKRLQSLLRSQNVKLDW